MNEKIIWNFYAFYLLEHSIKLNVQRKEQLFFEIIVKVFLSILFQLSAFFFY